MSASRRGRFQAGEDRCITCGDEAVAMRVTELRDGGALCEDDGGRMEVVALDLLDGVDVGATVLVHAGVAIGAPR